MDFIFSPSLNQGHVFFEIDAMERLGNLTMDADTVKTRILVLSDTHSTLPAPANSNSLSYRWPLPKVDVLLHAGDLTGTGKIEQHEKALQLLSNVDAELKIVIPGNHDMTLHREYCKGTPMYLCPRYDDATLTQIEQMYTGNEAQSNGIVYMVEGTQTFTLKNGAKFTVYANAWQPEYHNWGFNYPREQDRFNPARQGVRFQAPHLVPGDGVDIMITHGPPMGILDRTLRHEDVGCEHLRRAVERVRPRLHVFGHIHEAWGGVKKDWRRAGKESEEDVRVADEKEVADKMGVHYDATGLEAGKETLFINASIMDLGYRPVQAPWVVDLMLPRL
jgi:Icc-related predicted phosphoesterase